MSSRTPTRSASEATAGASACGPRLPVSLVTAFVVIWILLAVAPRYRQDWLLENLVVFAAVPMLMWSYRHLRFSNCSYLALSVFLVLHEVGAQRRTWRNG